MASNDATDRGPDVIDHVDADAEGAEQKARTESLENRQTLSQQARQQRADARAGKPTGIPDEFGPLELSISKDSQRVAASHVERNQDGRVTRVDYPQPEGPKSFGYSADGRLNQVTDKNGWSWRRETDGGWQLYNSNNER